VPSQLPSTVAENRPALQSSQPKSSGDRLTISEPRPQVGFCAAQVPSALQYDEEQVRSGPLRAQPPRDAQEPQLAPAGRPRHAVEATSIKRPLPPYAAGGAPGSFGTRCATINSYLPVRGSSPSTAPSNTMKRGQSNDPTLRDACRAATPHLIRSLVGACVDSNQ
jgi:hypothetical protein